MTHPEIHGWPQCPDHKYDRTTVYMTRCRKPAGHPGRHDDGALSWCASDCGERCVCDGGETEFTAEDVRDALAKRDAEWAAALTTTGAVRVPGDVNAFLTGCRNAVREERVKVIREITEAWYDEHDDWPALMAAYDSEADKIEADRLEAADRKPEQDAVRVRPRRDDEIGDDTARIREAAAEATRSGRNAVLLPADTYYVGGAEPARLDADRTAQPKTEIRAARVEPEPKKTCATCECYEFVCEWGPLNAPEVGACRAIDPRECGGRNRRPCPECSKPERAAKVGGPSPFDPKTFLPPSYPAAKWPREVSIYERCVMDCIDRGWSDEHQPHDTNKRRSRRYMRMDLVNEMRDEREAMRDLRAKLETLESTHVRILAELRNVVGVDDGVYIVDAVSRALGAARAERERAKCCVCRGDATLDIRSHIARALLAALPVVEAVESITHPRLPLSVTEAVAAFRKVVPR